jgi:guanylate kinase
MQVPPTFTIDFKTALEYLKFAGYLATVVTATWKMSRFATGMLGEAKAFGADVKAFMHEVRDHMGEMQELANTVVNNHLHHIQESMEDIQKQMKEAQFVRVVDSENERKS